MTYYIVHSISRAVVRESRFPFNVDENIQPPAPHIQLKRVDNDTVPNFNPATQKTIRSFVDNDSAFTRTFSWQVVAKTQQEMDEFQRQTQDAATLQIIRDVYQDLKNGVGTAAERLTRVERAVAWLLKDNIL